jgi:hypothetical protein
MKDRLGEQIFLDIGSNDPCDLAYDEGCCGQINELLIV